MRLKSKFIVSDKHIKKQISEKNKEKAEKHFMLDALRFKKSKEHVCSSSDCDSAEYNAEVNRYNHFISVRNFSMKI